MTHLDVTLRRALLSPIELLVLEVHLPDVAIIYDAGVEVLNLLYLQICREHINTYQYHIS